MKGLGGIMAKKDPSMPLATRRVGFLIALTIIYIILNILTYILYERVAGVELNETFGNIMLIVISIATVGSLYAVFILVDTTMKYKSSKDIKL